MATEQTLLKTILGGKAADNLAKHRQIRTVRDLLDFWPSRHRSAQADLGHPREGEYLVAVARVARKALRRNRSGRGSRLEVAITDGRNSLDLTFFHAAQGHDRGLIVGEDYLFGGKVGRYRGRWQLAHPGYTPLEKLDGDTERGLISIYRHVPGAHSWTISECVRLVLKHLDEVPDPLPAEVVSRRGLLSRDEALRRIHTPRSWDELARARERLRFEEALVLQVILGQRRRQQAQIATRGRGRQEGGLLDAFDERLPFTLTAGQEEVSAQILTDMARDTPMHRLLQGEVGSGKTIVALRAMLAAVDAGGQAALLAPTEVLAAQHARSIRALLGDLGEAGMLGGAEHATRVTLLTGSMSTQARREALLEIASGQAGIVIGTHALIEETVSFADLALVVVDEQHRFGVEQRDALRAKGEHPPHVLVMTATPIPRTVAMTVFGDMETSTLRELPRGRQPITTHVVPTDKQVWVERSWARVAEEVRGGRQAYVVCPRIGGDEDADATDGLDLVSETPFEEDDFELIDEGAPEPPARPLASVHEVLHTLRQTPVLTGLRMEMLHGRMSADDKDSIMRRYAAGEIDVLVSTTVIEVGVDVPNASVMVVVDADRFGISQLHQLRGRVGRGGHPGLCLLFTASEAPSAQERLGALAQSSDGFELARLDLSQRREGDVLGVRQHGGHSQLQHLSLLRDEDLIIAAREDAGALLAADPDLAAHPLLAAEVESWVDAEQAAYLEKG